MATLRTAALRHVPDIGDQERLGISFIAGESYRVSTRSAGTEHGSVVGAKNKGRVAGISKIQALGGSRVYVARSRARWNVSGELREGAQ